jgi:LysR family transcriptional regulator, glycine cleavage system transcriptional activator
MAIPRRFLPPTAMLAAFEAAARTGSFTQAGVELSLTQSAVSRQIRALEERLGADLFVRERQAVKLTEAGLSYAREIREALKHIGDASMAVRASPRAASLNLAVLPAFASRWLIPRLPSFLAANPDVTINFSTRLAPFEFAAEPFDAAIHFGHPAWMGAESIPLMGETVVALAGRVFLESHQFASPEDLLSAPLLILRSRPDAWERWFLANGVYYDSVNGPLFDQFDSMASAAKAGVGVALLPAFLFEEEVTRGELVPLFDKQTPSDDSYHLVWPHSRRDNPTMILFRNWLEHESRSLPTMPHEHGPDPYPARSRKRSGN